MDGVLLEGCRRASPPELGHWFAGILGPLGTDRALLVVHGTRRRGPGLVRGPGDLEASDPPRGLVRPAPGRRDRRSLLRRDGASGPGPRSTRPQHRGPVVSV